MNTITPSKYIIVFFITATIFALALYLSTILSTKKAEEIKATADKISIDILSLETQFDLLQESSCKKIGPTMLSNELNILADKLAYAEAQKGINDDDVLLLKKYYSLLEIKDYLLLKKVQQKCGIKPTAILYFYSNSRECDECIKQGYVLTHIRQTNPDVRVYSFDYDLDLNTLKTLTSLYGIQGDSLPALVIDEKVHEGFQDVDAVLTLIPSLKKSATTTTATSTKKSF